MSRLFDAAFVCTGNRFRSVLAAAAFAAAVEEPPVRVDSYGTLDIGPAEALPGAVREAAALGLDVSSHRARRLTDADLSGADLVVGFELAHVAAAVESAGAPLERTFVLSELLDLLTNDGSERREDPVDTGVARVASAHDRRRGGSARKIVEIPDPVLLAESGQAAVARQVVDETRTIARLLFGVDDD